MAAVGGRASAMIGLFMLVLVAAHVPQGLAAGWPAAHRSPSDPSIQDNWCDPASVHWSEALDAPSQVVLGKQDLYSCAVLSPAAVYGSNSSSSSSVTQIALQINPNDAARAAAGITRLRQALLLDCDAQLWQLAGIQNSETACLASTSVLRAACNQWLINIPAQDQLHTQSCAPHDTAFASTSSLQGRVLVLQTHWQLPESAVNQAVALPAVSLQLGTPVAADADASTVAEGSANNPALLGTFVGSGIYPPSHISSSLQAFTVPADSNSSAKGTAALACSKRCTYVPLGKLNPKPVTVVGYSFETFDRAVSVEFEIQRGKWAKWTAAGETVRVVSAPGQGVVQLQQPFKLYAGDTVRWRCSYDMSGMQPGSALQGGYSSSPAAQQEQCTVALHYWPRVEAMRGCSAALDSDLLKGENMCSSEAEDLMKIRAGEDNQFPMRRMYQEHSFPAASWMGGWKATHMVMLMAVVWANLWGFHTLLSTCKALGPIHRRFISLHAGQQRNVALYLTHLVLDTAALVFVFQPMIELWLGMTETVAEVQAGMWAFSYLVACYALELTWRRSIDTMLAVHHTGTITIILLYAGELTSSTYRVANSIIVLAAFAVMEQPTYVALLLKRMLPSRSIHVVRAAKVGYISWFVLKGFSVLLAATMLIEDWHIMPVWIRVNFIITWIIAIAVQGWSGLIQRGIYKHIKRAHKHSKWEFKQEQLKRRAALVLHAQGCPTSSDEETDGGSTPRSRAASHGGLSTPLLRRNRIIAVSGDSLGGSDTSPFELITAEPALLESEEDKLAAFGRQSTGTSQDSGVMSQESSDSGAACKLVESAAWQAERVGSSQGRLRPSNSFVNISQSGISAPSLQQCASLPLAVERNLHALHAQRSAFSPCQ